jgi:hypothetical protein
MVDNLARFGINEKASYLAIGRDDPELVNPALIATVEGDPDDLAANLRLHAR